jgi:hypothetical protein
LKYSLPPNFFFSCTRKILRCHGAHQWHSGLESVQKFEKSKWTSKI